MLIVKSAASWRKLSFTAHWLLVLSLCFFVEAASAQKKSKRRTRDTGQTGLVIVDGSAIYQAPNFDSPVLEYLDRGKKVFISKRVYRGVGGLGAFYKVRLRPRSYGYITDVDIEVDGDSSSSRTQPTDDSTIDGDPTVLQPDLEDESEPFVADGSGIYFTRFLGPTIQMVNYTEVLNNAKKSSAMQVFGGKLSGPGSWLGGMPLDFEVLAAFSAPDFYDKIASSTSGFMVMAHMMPMFPFVTANRYVLYYSFGPMLRYSSFKVKLKSQPTAPDIDSQEMALGFNVGLGFAWQVGQRYALRFDGRYTYENESYFGAGAAFQFQY